MKKFTINENLIGTGQPHREDLKSFAEDGVKRIVNLRTESEDGYLADTAQLVAELGMDYVHLPISGKDGITIDNARALDRLVDGVLEKTVIHCGTSNRVGALWALKRKFIDGASAEVALADGQKAGLTGLESHVESLLRS